MLIKRKLAILICVFLIFLSANIVEVVGDNIVQETEITVENRNYIIYYVKPGDSLYRLAQRYDTSINEIRRLNNLESDLILIGQELKIPFLDYLSYTVKAGDSLYRLARKYETTVEKIKAINNLSGDIIYIGQELRIPVAKPSSTFVYRIRAGDTLYSIAKRFATTIQEIKAINNLTGDLIYVNQELNIPLIKYPLNIYIEGEGMVKQTKIEQINPQASMYESGALVELLAQADEGWQFDSWRGDLTSSTNPNTILIDEEKTVTAVFVRQNTVDYSTVTGRVNISNRTGQQRVSETEELEFENIFPLNKPILPAYEQGEIIVKFNANITSQTQDEIEELNNLIFINEFVSDETRIINYRLPEDKDVEEMVDYYSQLENVDWVEPNYIFYPTAIPNDSFYSSRQWNLVNLNLEAAWDKQKGDNFVIVAVLDTGVIPNHPDLQANLLQGADFVGGENTYPVERYKKTNDDPTDETTRAEGGSHGTHVAGIIGAVTNNNRGVAGVNWNVSILPVRVLRRGGGTSWDVVEGIYYAIDQGADIINMSLGSNHYSQLQKEAIRAAVNQGITVIAASGNEGSDSVYYPAAFPETIAVGAVQRDNNKTPYSNYGPQIDVVAPGGGYGESIFSTWGYYEEGNTVSDYAGMIGTSMAAPHVSGVAALLIASGVEGVENIRERLTSTAIDLGVEGKNDYYGYGLVDAYAALLGEKLAKPKVFVASKAGNTFNLKSEIVRVDKDYNFSLNKVETGNNLYLVAWRDVNKNGIIDQGDYFNYTSINIAQNSSNNVNLTINYISNNTLDNNLILNDFDSNI